MLVQAFMMNGLCLISKQLLVGHVPLTCLMPPALRCFLIQSCLYEDGTNLTEDRQLEEVQLSESDAANKNPVSNCAESAFPCRRQENVNSAVGDSCWGDSLLRDTSYDSRRRMNDCWEGNSHVCSLMLIFFPLVPIIVRDSLTNSHCVC
jgi:hypothetical protein